MPLDKPTDPHTAESAEWPEIDRSLLGEARPAPVVFPLDLLPGRWRAWVEAAARPFGSPDYLAHCLLGGVAAVCGAGTVMRVTPHWREPLLLWQALVGGPSSGKSAAFARVRGLVEAVKPREEKDNASAAPAILVDAVLDRVEGRLWRSPHSVLLWRDDLAAWMGEARRREERPAWLAAWDAGPAMIGHSAVACFPVGIMGALHPERLAPGFADVDSALAARFLYAWPEAGQGGSLSGAEADDEGLVAMLRTIASFSGHPETPGSVGFNPEAVARLEELMALLGRQRGEAQDMEAEWIGKGVATIVRLTGLLALMHRAEKPESEGTLDDVALVEAAHTLWAYYYLPQAQSVFDRAGVAGCELAARRTARWLRNVRSTVISREDVRRQALCQTVNAAVAEDVIARLEAAGLLRALPATGSAEGGPRLRRWAVNPQLVNGSWRS